MFISKSSPQVSLKQHVHVVQVKCSINDFGSALDLLAVLLVLAEAESHVVENGCFNLGDFLLKQGEILNKVLEL